MQLRKLKTKLRKFEQVKDSKGNPVPGLFRHIPSGRIHVRKNFRRLGIPALSQTTGETTLGRARTASEIIIQRHRNFHLGIDDTVTFGKRKSLTVSELIKKCLAEYTHAPDQGLRARTKAKHEWFFAEIDRELGGMGVESITVETFRAWMRRKSQTRASLFDYAKHLTLLFRFAHNHKLVSHPIKFPDPNRGEKIHEDRVYTDLEIQKIWTALSEDGKDQFVLSYECLMRLGEVLGLEWDRVNFRTGEIVLRDEDVKTGRGRRFIASSRAINRLEQRAKRLPKGISPYVFPSPTNSQKPVIHNRGTWRTAKRNAGITGRATWHALRHTALTKALLEKNLDPLQVGQYAGVAVNTIERVYLHAKADHTRHVSKAVSIWEGDEWGSEGDST